MRLKVLIDNTAVIDQYYLAEPALSSLLDDGDIRLLFDTGYSGAFLANADSMGEDLSAPDAIIISHGHNDHSAGLVHWLARFSMDHNPSPIPGTPTNSTSSMPALVAHPVKYPVPIPSKACSPSERSPMLPDQAGNQTILSTTAPWSGKAMTAWWSSPVAPIQAS